MLVASTRGAGMGSVEQGLREELAAVSDLLERQLTRPTSEVSEDAKTVAYAIRELGLRIEIQLVRR